MLGMVKWLRQLTRWVWARPDLMLVQKTGLVMEDKVDKTDEVVEPELDPEQADEVGTKTGTGMGMVG